MNSETADLAALADELLAQADEMSRSAARTLPHPVDGLHRTVLAPSDGADLTENENPGAPTPVVLLTVARGGPNR
jgi:hypothetical protein